MTIPVSIGPLRSYYDPTLWRRLEPEIRAHLSEKTEHFIDAKWKTLEEARQMVGYLKALEWVLATAGDLTREQEDQHRTE